MPKIPIPLTNQSIDPTGDPTGAVWTMVVLALGFGAFGIASSFGNDVRGWVMDRLPIGSSGDGGATLQLGA